MPLGQLNPLPSVEQEISTTQVVAVLLTSHASDSLGKQEPERLN